MSINSLHIYQLIEIFEYLNLEERHLCSSVCKLWRDAIIHLGIRSLKIFYFTRSEDVNDFNDQSSLEPFKGPNANQAGSLSNKKKFAVYTKSDKLLMQLDNPQFHKLRKLKIFANSSLKLADSYLNLTKLKSLESLHIDNLSLCLCLKISLERDAILLDNLKFVNLYRVNLKILLIHFPNLIKIKCVQVERLNGEQITQATRWSHFELVDNYPLHYNVMEECFLLFLIANCEIIEELKLNVREIDDVIFLIKNLKNLRRLSFNCRVGDRSELRDRLLDLIKLIRECNSSGQSLKVEFNAFNLTDYDFLNSTRLDKFLSIKSDPNTLTYFDLVEINRLHTKDYELTKRDLESLSNWCRSMHINQNLEDLRILTSSIALCFVNCRQLCFKAFDYDENVNDQQLNILFSKLPNLIALEMKNVQRLSQKIMNRLPEAWPLLKEIDLSFNLEKKICLQFISRYDKLSLIIFYKNHSSKKILIFYLINI